MYPDPTTKRCSTCGVEKPLTEFSKHKKSHDGIRSQCKDCDSVYRRAYYARNRERAYEVWRQYRNTHPDDIRAYKRDYHRRNSEAINQKLRERHQAQPEIKRAKRREYAQRNHDKVRAWAKDWYDKHIEQCRKETRDAHHRRYEQDPNKVKIDNSRWKKANPQALLAIKHRRRAKKAGNGGSHTVQEWLDLKAQYDHRCLRCGKQEPQIKLTRDHIMPIARGGTDNIDNLQPLCRSCNSRKHAKTIDYR